MAAAASKASVADRAKELLAEPRHRIALDDFVNEHLRTALAAIGPDKFPVSGAASNAAFADRVAGYDAAVGDLLQIVVLLARWGDETEGRIQLEKTLRRVAETAWSGGGNTLWLRLRSYPLVRLMYGAGISALSAGRYGMLASTFLPTVGVETSRHEQTLVLAVLSPLIDIAGSFKALPGLEQKKYPRSEHLFATLQAPLDELLFLGRDYESLFDRFEIFVALGYADLRDPKGEGDVWGPPGRFAWKHRHSDGPMDPLIDEAKEAGDGWPPLRAGLFGGQSRRFMRVGEAYRQVVQRYG